MRLAIKDAKEGIRDGQTPLGAFMVRDGKVIGCAHDALWKITDVTAFAEIIAIRDACEKLITLDLSGFTILSVCVPCPIGSAIVVGQESPEKCMEHEWKIQ